MLSVIIIVLLLGIIAYLVLDKKTVKMDDVKTFLKDSGTKLKEESGPLFEKVKSSFASVAEEVGSRFSSGYQEGFPASPLNNLPASVAPNDSYLEGGFLPTLVPLPSSVLYFVP